MQLATYARVASSKPRAWPWDNSEEVRSGGTTPSRTKRPTLAGNNPAYVDPRKVP